MNSFFQASEAVTSHLDKVISVDDGGYMITKVELLSPNIGWVFFYNSKKFSETRNPLDGYGGNSPIIYDRLKEQIQFTGTARPLDYYVNKYLEENNYLKNC